MKVYVCTVCGYLYEESKGVPGTSILPGTKWEDLPDTWSCPLCGAPKTAFREKGEQAIPLKDEGPKQMTPERELSAIEVSVICSNLARGCEKQYLDKESEQFSLLAAKFAAAEKPAKEADFASLLALVEQDLAEGYPYANYISGAEKDRGALRALVWSEKVTNMLRSLLSRYAKEGDRMLEHTGVYLCTICGFVFIGNTPPEICPVCKVPSWKFEKIEGRAV